MIIKQDFSQLADRHDLPRAEEIGAAVLTTVTATCVLFEIIGPILAKIALKKAGEIHENN